MLEKWKKLSARDMAVNLLLYLAGIVLMPLGVVLTVNAHLGAGGYDALNFALGDKLSINTSLAIYITAILAVLLAAVVRRGFPRITTFVSSFFLGFFTDFWKNALKGVEGSGIVDSGLMFLAGMVIIAFAVASYILCIFPPNPTDDLVAALAERGMRISVAKISLDVVCMAGAILMRGEIGIGTIVCTFGLGPLVDLFYGRLKAVTQKLHITVE